MVANGWNEMDNEVTFTFVFHAMGDDPGEAMNRCWEFFGPAVREQAGSVQPQELYVTVKPR